ncbi:unnamed protein product [Enterobius vermicularis]|uniref:C3H1-type domain-containing protein n=1 Tax=Enterobius vermicularis TaxID=51028 RepID=A0A0N4UTE3_ENTVE|nr:unnamed protein product [Enterobius vermicularis]
MMAIASASFNKSLTSLDVSSEPLSTGAKHSNAQFLSGNQTEELYNIRSSKSTHKYGYLARLENRGRGSSKLLRNWRRSAGHQSVTNKISSFGSDSPKEGGRKLCVFLPPKHGFYRSGLCLPVSGVPQTSEKNAGANLTNAADVGSQNNSSSKIDEGIADLERRISKIHFRGPNKRPGFTPAMGRSRQKRQIRKHKKRCISCCMLSGSLYVPLQHKKHTLETVDENAFENLGGQQEEACQKTEKTKRFNMYMWCGYCVLGEKCPYSHRKSESEN